MKSSDFNKVITKLKQRFELKDDSGDHISYEIWKSNVYIARIKNSRSSNDFIDNLIAKNLHISRTKLREYKDCAFSNEQLIQKIKDKGYWPKNS